MQRQVLRVGVQAVVDVHALDERHLLQFDDEERLDVRRGRIRAGTRLCPVCVVHAVDAVGSRQGNTVVRQVPVHHRAHSLELGEVAVP